MPIFDVDIRGTKYQIDAPDENQAATQALKLSQQTPADSLDVERQKALALAQGAALAEQQAKHHDITMPDGTVVRFPGHFTDTQIRGLIASKYPREVGEAMSAKGMIEVELPDGSIAEFPEGTPDDVMRGAIQPQRDQSQAIPFEGSNIPGYDPATGIVRGGPIDDNLGQEYGVGLRRTAEATAGLPGDIGSMFGGAGSALAGVLGAGQEEQGNIANIISKIASTAFNPVGAVLPYDNAISTEQIREKVTDPLFGRPDEPLTAKGQAARTTGEFAGGAFLPGGAIRKAAMMLAPAAASETAGYYTEGTPYEPYARTGAALLAGGVTAAARSPGTRAPLAAAARDLGVKTKDMTRIIKRMQQDGFTPQQIQARLAELGPGATMLDVGPNLRQEGQRIYAQGGRGRGIIDETLTARDAGANQRMRTEIDDTLGPVFSPTKIDAGLKRTQRNLSPEYERVLGNARAVNTEAIANDIESAIANTRGEARNKLVEVRNMLRIEGSDVLDPHPRTALATRQAIDGMLESATDGNVRGRLGDIRRKLDAELTRAAPGIKEVDAKWSGLAKQREAVKRGQTVLDAGRSSPWPSDLADEIARGGRAVGFRLSQGTRAEIERIVGNGANDRVNLQRLIKGEGNWNHQKLELMFGKDRAGKLLSVLEREKTFAETSNRVMKNSASAERLPEGGGSSFGMRDAFSAGGPKALAYSGLVKGVEAAVNKIRGSAAAGRDERVARILSSTDTQKIAMALLKANGGRPLPADQIDGAVRTLLLTSGATGQNR